jgi:hypothetical protein
LAAGAVVAVIAFAAWENAARFLPLPAVHSAQFLPDSFQARANLRRDLAWTPPHASARFNDFARVPGVYPYSVAPGGIKDAAALRKLTASDPALSRHFARFDYDRARLIRVTEAREVYVSYRIRDTIFWTSKKVHLRPGELLLTDGTITARAKCGNQVSDTAKPEVSNEEPEESVLENPVVLAEVNPPVRPVLAPFNLPSGEPTPPQTYSGGFIFPYAPVGGGPPLVCSDKNGNLDKRCQPRHHHTPEPSAIILMASGLAAVLWCYRMSRRRAAA